MRNKNIEGKRFGRLVAIEPVGKDGQGYVLWRCKCDCGNEKITSLKYLGRGTSSCGCYAREISTNRLTKHGKRYTRLYQVHKTMLQRCNNPNAHEYENYGGRGIKVCDEWRTFEGFEKWAMENGYDDTAKHGKCTLDRIDPNGNYEPNNCRWTTMKHQQRNRRNNVLITYNGETHCMSEWAEIIGIPYGTFQQRIAYGWSIERAITAPLTR